MDLLLRRCCLLLSLCLTTSASAQSPPKEPDAPQPTASVKEALDRSAVQARAGQWTQALATADVALAAASQATDAPGTAGADRARALALEKLGRSEEAVTAWRETAIAWQQAGDGPGQVAARLMEGAMLIASKPQEARALLEEALRAGKAEVKRPLAAAGALRQGGVAFYIRGHLDESEGLWKASLVQAQRISPDSLDVAACLNDLGNVAEDHGDLAAAADYYKRSLTLRERQAPISLDVAASLNNLGVVADDQGDSAAAAEYYRRSLTIKEKLAADPADIAVTLNNLGVVAEQRGNLTAAVRYYVRSLALREKLAPNSLKVAESLDNIGSLNEEQGDLTVAEKYHMRSLTIKEKSAPDSLEIAASLIDLSDVAEKQHRLPAAEDYARRAWNIVRNQAGQVQGDQARLAFAASNHTYAAALLRLQITLHHPDDAFLTLQQSRAQALLQLLAERRLLTATAAEPAYDNYQDAQAQHGRALQSLDRAATQQALSQKALQEAKDQTQTAKLPGLQQRLTEATSKVQQVQAEETRTRLQMEARFAQLIHASVQLVGSAALSLDQAHAALPSDALFLAFCVDDRQTTLFLLRHTGPLQTFTLPVTQKQLQQQVDAFRTLLSSPGTFEATSRRAGQALFSTLFPPPAQQAIRQAGRLILSPDDALWECPFTALVPPGSASASPVWLGLQKPICLANSLALYAQACSAPLARRAGGSPVALVVGDCVFERTDRTAQALPQAPAKPTTAALASARRQAEGSPARGSIAPDHASVRRQSDADVVSDVSERAYLYENGKPPSSLPATAEEARRIAALYHTRPLLGDQATEAQVRLQLPQADVIHLATHGVLRRSVPLASGVLLSVPQRRGKAAEPEDDGDLQAWEWAGMTLHADLAVLSACETGLGERITGEGVEGLTRALAVAGCRSVVTSLWRVPDASTAKLMGAFHAALRRGVSKDEALMQAMQSVVKASGGRLRAPVFWAAFFLMGDTHNHLANSH